MKGLNKTYFFNGDKDDYFEYLQFVKLITKSLWTVILFFQLNSLKCNCKNSHFGPFEVEHLGGTKTALLHVTPEKYEKHPPFLYENPTWRLAICQCTVHHGYAEVIMSCVHYMLAAYFS